MTLQETRENAHLSISELSFVTGIDERTIRALESTDDDAALPRKSTVVRYLVGCNLPMAEAQKRAARLIAKLKNACKSPTPPAWLGQVFDQAIEREASYVHLDFTDSIRARFRINAKLELVDPPKAPKSYFEAVDETGFQDLYYQHKYNGRTYAIRGCAMPSSSGQEIRFSYVFRIIYGANQVLRTLNDIVLHEGQKSMIKSALVREAGLILISGPTGCGKSVTATAMLTEIANDKINVVGIESPIEVQIPHVKQIQVDNERRMTFEQSLRASLRSDPEIIFVSEVRDEETVALMEQAVLAGCVVIATVHAADANSAITRVADIGGVPRGSIEKICLLSINQRLVCRDDGKGRFAVFDMINFESSGRYGFTHSLQAALEKGLISDETRKQCFDIIGPRYCPTPRGD